MHATYRHRIGFLFNHRPDEVWHAAPIAFELAQLGPALERAVAEHFRYKAKQERAFNDTFELTATPSAERAARAILDFIAR